MRLRDARPYPPGVKAVAVACLIGLTIAFLVARSPLYFMFAMVTVLSLTIRR